MLMRPPPDRTPRKPQRPRRNADTHFLGLALVVSLVATGLIIAYALFYG